MKLVALVAVLAALLGVVSGGSLNSLAATKFRAPLLVAIAVALNLGVLFWPTPWPRWGGLALLVGSNLATAAFLLLNRHLPGMILALAGMALNLVVIGANGAMPVSANAAEVAGIPMPVDAAGIEHERLDDHTRLPWLADAIPIQPPIGVVISVGDVVLSLGIFRLVYERTRAQPRARHRYSNS